MMSKKIPVHMSDADYNTVKRVSKSLGLGTDVYGWFPKTVKFSITFYEKAAASIANLIPDLNEENLDLFLSSIKKIKLRKYQDQKIAELKETKENL